MNKNVSKDIKYKYRIIYDLKKDAWNWRDGVGGTFLGDDTIDRIKDETDSQIAHQILGLKKQPAEAILKPYLLAQKVDPNSKLNKFIQIAEADFRGKFTDACLALERITKHPMVSNEFTFYVTTFPRMTVFFKAFEIFMYNSIEGVWGMPIDGFLHEALHFQFNHYWRENPASPVSKLSEDEFTYLKEALVVVLDDELKPLITVPDKGYPSQAVYCGLLHKHWIKYHDFDKLVEFGLTILSKYVDTTTRKSKTNFKQLKTPNDLLEYMNANITYGFLGKNGRKYIDQNEDWQKDWETECIVQSGEGVLKTNCGTCWDQVELERMWFDNHIYKFETIFIWFEINKPNVFPTHTFLAFQEGDKWYWFEHSFYSHKGIHEFDSLDELISDVKDKLLRFAINSGVAKLKDKKLLKSYFYNKPKSNLRVSDYINHVIGR